MQQNLFFDYNNKENINLNIQTLKSDRLKSDFQKTNANLQQQQQQSINIPTYEITRVLGSGCFGYVFEAFDRVNNRKVALKRIQKAGTQVSREYEILAEINNGENVVHMLDFFYTKSSDGKLIQNIVFEYLENNLESMLQAYIKKKIHFDPARVKNYIYQVLKGLEFIHSKNISHRDLKPENILLSDDGVIKLCDFGSSKVIDSEGKNTPYIVSRYYRAPELILCIQKYTPAIDIWSTGCILAELITNQPLFLGKTEGEQIFKIFEKLGSFNEEEMKIYKERVPFEPENIFHHFNNFKRQDLSKLNEFQPVKNDPQFFDLLYKMLEFLPEKRITASEALKHPYFNSLFQ